MGFDIRRMLTSFAKGELSPLIEGRPDLAAFFEGLSRCENWNLLRQGGLTRRPGTIMICEVKDSSKDTIIISFEAGVNDAFIVELGDEYARFIKAAEQLIDGAALPIEVISPYTEAILREMHYTQSVDVGFMFHRDIEPRRLTRITDEDWSIGRVTHDPPPTIEEEADISGGTVTLTPGATSGNDVTFTASAAVFLKADVGRQIIFEVGRGVITQIGASAGSPSPQATVLVDIIDAFDDLDPFPAGEWFLRLSPQAAIDLDHKNPVGRIVRVETAGEVTFRAADVGKYISVYGGLLKITRFVSSSSIRAIIVSSLDGVSEGDPPAAPAGSWTLRVEAWSDERGWPGTGEFYQGRLGAASTYAQPTNFWLSDSDSFDKFATGIAANKAIDYTMATRGLNRIECMVDNKDLFIHTAGTEHKATGGRSDEPLGGDQIPLVTKLSGNGSAPIQAMVVDGRIIFVGRDRRKIFSMAYNIEEDGHKPVEVTGAAEHITEGGIKLGCIAFATRPDPRLFFVREDGQLISLTYSAAEKVIGFTRYITDGEFQSVAVIPQPATTQAYQDQVYVVVKRTINGVTKRFIEMFQPETVLDREWKSLQTDCAKIYNLSGIATDTLTSLDHLRGKTVDVVADSSFVGTHVVSAGGTVTLAEIASVHAEVGLHYDSIATTMRPGIEGQMVEGLPRTWLKLWLRVHKSLGGKIMGHSVKYLTKHFASGSRLGTGDVPVLPRGIDVDDGKVTFTQDQPYPMTVLAMFGEIQFGDHT